MRTPVCPMLANCMGSVKLCRDPHVSMLMKPSSSRFASVAYEASYSDNLPNCSRRARHEMEQNKSYVIESRIVLMALVETLSVYQDTESIYSLAGWAGWAMGEMICFNKYIAIIALFSPSTLLCVVLITGYSNISF